jgi:hypothetical protein
LALIFRDTCIDYFRSDIVSLHINRFVIKMHFKQVITAGMAMIALSNAVNPRADGLPPAVAARKLTSHLQR